MPMSFPDLKSLKFAAEIHNFREQEDNESEDDYRKALADHVMDIDFVESCEIRFKVGWDEFTPEQNQMMLSRQFK